VISICLATLSKSRALERRVSERTVRPAKSYVWAGLLAGLSFVGLASVAHAHPSVSPGSCNGCHNGGGAPSKPAGHVATSASCDTCHMAANTRSFLSFAGGTLPTPPVVTPPKPPVTPPPVVTPPKPPVTPPPVVTPPKPPVTPPPVVTPPKPPVTPPPVVTPPKPPVTPPPVVTPPKPRVTPPKHRRDSEDDADHDGFMGGRGARGGGTGFGSIRSRQDD
jgi:hypothetical protein